MNTTARQVINRKDAKDAAAVRRTCPVCRGFRFNQDARDQEAGQNKEEIHTPHAELKDWQEPSGDRSMLHEHVCNVAHQDSNDCQSANTIERWNVLVFQNLPPLEPDRFATAVPIRFVPRAD
jgi:hypothetical protein